MSHVLADNKLWLHRSQQQTFRRVLNAVSYPGTREQIQQDAGLLEILACLADRMTAIHDRDQLLTEEAIGLLGATITTLEEARFVLAKGSIPPASDWCPPQGSLESPEFGGTILLQCDDLHTGDLHLEVEGPGIKESSAAHLSGLDPRWVEHRHEWVSEFPKGVDFLLIGGEEVMAWPRTTRIRIR